MDRVLAGMIEEAQAGVRVAPKSADAWGRLGQSYDAVDFDDQAQRCYEQAASLDRRSARWLHLLGVLQLQETPAQGLENLRRAAELSGPGQDASRLRLARALLERGRLEDAEEQLSLLLNDHPGHPAGMVELARARLARGQLDGMTEFLAPCLTNSYTARPATLLLARAAQEQGQTDAAAELTRRAASMPRPFDWPDPFLMEVDRLRGGRQRLQDQANMLLAQGRLSEAGQALERLFRAYPGDVEGMLLLGRLRIQQRNCAEAETILRQLLERQPASLNGLTQLSIALLCQQRWGEAAAALRQALAVKPDFAQAHYNLGLALSRQGQRDQALASYREALRCSPGDVGAHLALAEELARAGDSEAARDHLNRARELAPEDPRVKRLTERLPSP